MSNPFFIAEISANHLGSPDRAHRLVEAAGTAGANAVKFQTYTPDTMTLKKDEFHISEDHALWGGLTLHQLYAEAMTPWEWHKELFEHAISIGLVPFSSPFDHSAVDFLEGIGCPMYKIASMETGDVDLIEYVGRTGKPMIMSTGASTLEEISLAVTAARRGGCNDLTLLVCTSAYPTHPRESHIKRINTLRKEFGTQIGISDHTLGVGVSLAAIALGATMVEKHLTLQRVDGGHDSAFSMEPSEFEFLVSEGKSVAESLGSPDWVIQPSEQESRKLRRSLFISQNVRKGEVATRANVKSLRPNLGGPIINMNLILGKSFNDDYVAGTAATIECVE